jgi:hypothetical protein
MLYRAYQSEDESQNSTEQSQMHLKNFYTLIQLFREAQMRLGNVLAPKEITNEAA